uniref:Uncharacterized protein n=1 Tax=Meloidogyne enterolobii TaxID=390850 RepID=A0A6V7WQM1_MELEN|nr:unnamed protein product [Meloidogyne enterolobii]
MPSNLRRKRTQQREYYNRKRCRNDVNGSFESENLVDGSVNEGSLVVGNSSFLDDGCLSRDSLIVDQCSSSVDDGRLNRDSLVVGRGSDMFVDDCLGENSFEIDNLLVENTLEKSVVERDTSIESDISKIDIMSNFSSSVSRCITPVSEVSLLPKRGRPLKRTSCGGRKKKVVENSEVLHSDIVTNFEHLEFLDIPYGPLLRSDIRIFAQNINPVRDYIKDLWSNPNSWLEENYIYYYLNYLTTRTNKRIVVLDPAFSFVDYQYGDRDPLIPIENCFNYSVDYDILLMPICFPGHFGLIIYDRYNRNDIKCLFVDSLPAVDRLFNVRYPGFDIRRIDLIKQGINSNPSSYSI